MKKFLVIGLAFLSGLAFAETNKEVVNATPEKPFASIQVFDISGSEPKLMEGNKLSRSKPRQLCITLANLPVQEQNLFAEYFQAPAPMSLGLEGASIQVEENKKNFLITSNVPKGAVSNNILLQCWQFNKENPIGTYTLDLQFNDIVFKGLKFEILK